MTAVIVRAAIAPLFREASLRSEQLSQLVMGETARLEESRGAWRRVTGDDDGFGGWVHSGYLLEVDEAAADRWREDAVGWSLGAVLRVEGQRLPLPLRARVALDPGAARLPDGRRGEVTEGTVRAAGEIAAAARAQAPERWALEYFAGSPYEWGGVTPWGVDCSGLVQTTFAARGLVLPRDSSLQVACGTPVAPGAALPGDLLFFRAENGPAINHVAFAGEGDTLIHSTVSYGGVLREPWAAGSRVAGLRGRLVEVRRVG